MSEYPLGIELGDYHQFIAEVTKIAAFAVDHAGGNRKYPSVHLDALTPAPTSQL